MLLSESVGETGMSSLEQILRVGRDSWAEVEMGRNRKQEWSRRNCLRFLQFPNLSRLFSYSSPVSNYSK